MLAAPSCFLGVVSLGTPTPKDSVYEATERRIGEGARACARARKRERISESA